jgi:Zn-dependent protease
MDWEQISNGLAQWLCVVVVITLHEFGHAWMATRCGDDTAQRQGRVTLNPIAHIDPIGTVALPLIALALSITGHGAIAAFIIGWGKPVPVNFLQLPKINRDSILIAMAGPVMNLLLTLVVMVVLFILKWVAIKFPAIGDVSTIEQACLMLAYISMFLFFFNMIPVPPLDGSHVMRFLVGMKWETFFRITPYGFFIVIVLIQFPAVKWYLGYSTNMSVIGLVKFFGVY